MAGALKTTIYLDADAYEHIKEIARAVQRPPAELVREAVAEYAEKRRVRPKPMCVATGHSRRGDVSARAENLLVGMGRRK